MKTIEGWIRTNILFRVPKAWMNYCSPGDEVSGETVEFLKQGMQNYYVTDDLVQLGEPAGPEKDPKLTRPDGKIVNCPTWLTFERRHGRWYFCGYCFPQENVNRRI